MPKPLPILTSKVYLNIYDLHNMNSIGYYIGIGAFHTGVQVTTENGDDLEYCFGGHPFTFSGVFEIKPKTASGVKYRESIYMGEFKMTQKEFSDLIDNIADDFSGLSYHPLKKNCNSFSEEFIKRLLNRDIPGYINRLAHIGNYFTCILPSNFDFIPTAPESNENNPNVVTSLSRSNDKGPKPIIAQQPITNRVDNNNSSSSSSSNNNSKLNFYGSDNEDSDNELNDEKRKKILDAANKRYMQPIQSSSSSSSDSSNNSNPSSPPSSNENSPSVSSPLI